MKSARSRVRTSIALAAAIGISAGMLSCGMGGSAEQGNARISGAFSGGPEAQASINVRLVQDTYNPVDSTCGSVYATKTDSLGNFEFSGVRRGLYYLYAFDSTLSNTFLDGPYRIDDVWSPGRDSLRRASTVTLADVDSARDSLFSYYIKGTSEVKSVKDSLSHGVKIIGVPAGIHDVMRYSQSGTASFFTEKIQILPGDSISINYRNRPPRMSAVQLPSVVFVDSNFTATLTGIDPDSDSVFIQLATGLQAYYLDAASGFFTWTPKAADIPVRAVQFKLSDRRGAFSTFRWDVRIRHNGAAPAPEPPSGPAVCFAESTAVFSVPPPATACISSPTQYRFAWGTGDTSAWSQAASANLRWTVPGTYPVSVQRQCDDYLLASPWSAPLSVTVDKSRMTAAPVIKRGYTSMTTEDTLNIAVAPIACASLPLYRFFVNDKPVTDWQKDTSFLFIPDVEGLYFIRSAAWCDTAREKPSDVSQPCSVYAKTLSLPAPALSGDTTFAAIDNFPVSIAIMGDSMESGMPVLHRCNIFNKYISTDTTKLFAAFLIVRDTCTASPECRDTISVYFNDTTRWFRGYSFELLLYKPSGYYTLSMQASVKGLSESPWTNRFLSPR